MFVEDPNFVDSFRCRVVNWLIALEFPSLKDALCKIWLKYWRSGSGENDEIV